MVLKGKSIISQCKEIIADIRGVDKYVSLLPRFTSKLKEAEANCLGMNTITERSEMTYYRNLGDYLGTLDKRGYLTTFKNQIDKDTQLHPLVRLQFRGLPEEQRKAFLFENVVDSRGRQYDIPVAICALAGSSQIHAIGLMCQPEEISERLAQAELNPILPRLVDAGPVQEEIHLGDRLLEHGGLDEFPIPISTPGYDIAPFFSVPCWVTKDPDTGICNVGTYRAQLKSPTRTGICFGRPLQGALVHWRKCRERGVPLEAAIVIGGPPSIAYVAVSKFHIDTDELAVAGGIAGEPIEVVKCKTVDLEVPAHAEIVIEGELDTNELEPEAPFGEGSGYVGLTEIMPYFTVKCITHRQNPIWLALIDQFPPNESSKIRQHANESVIYKHLRYDLNMTQVLAVAFHDTLGSRHFFVIQFKKTESAEVWRALEAAGDRFPAGKVIVAVDEDINPWDPEAVNWAICYRVQPHRDCRIVRFPASSLLSSLLDQSALPPDEVNKRRLEPNPEMPEYSRLLIDTTMKWAYPPVSLPKKEFMEAALRLWQEAGLPELKLREPWWGYNLGCWSDEEEEGAALAVKGEYYRSGEIQAQRRQRGIELV
jgi:4-hydroxy-3-polyprenylbenzoate decarboxylase